MPATPLIKIKMRKTLIIIIFLWAITAFAQHKPFQFGFKGAANLGWFTSDADGYANQGTKFGGSWGFAADIFLMENYSLTTGFDVLYLNSTISYPDQKSSLPDGNIFIGVSTRKYKTQYIEIPIIFTMKTNEIGKLRYFGQIGFGLGFLISAKAEEDFVSDDGSQQQSENMNAYDDVRFTRESLIIGVGVELPIQGSTYLRAGLKYDNTFVNILKGYNTVDADKKNNGKNSFMEINISFFF